MTQYNLIKNFNPLNITNYHIQELALNSLATNHHIQELALNSLAINHHIQELTLNALATTSSNVRNIATTWLLLYY